MIFKSNSMNKISLAAALITKNAEETIAQTINSITQFCDQIVVVDTGSDDSTPIIASSLGAEVYYFNWNDDFSAARNFSLKFVRKNWVLIIDSDETLDADSFQKNIHLMNDDSIGGINIIIKNYLDTNLEQFSTHRYTRLFRYHPQIQFSGRIHEQIHNAIENLGFSIVESDIIIHHFGYNIEDPSKKIRNLEILKEESNKSQNDFYLKYHLASTEFSIGNFAHSKKLFEEIAGSNLLSVEQNELTKIRLAQIYLSENNLDVAEQWLDFQSDDDDREGFRQFILGAIKLSKKEFNNARALYSNYKVINSSYVDKKIIEEANKLFSLI